MDMGYVHKGSISASYVHVHKKGASTVLVHTEYQNTTQTVQMIGLLRSRKLHQNFAIAYKHSLQKQIPHY